MGGWTAAESFDMHHHFPGYYFISLPAMLSAAGPCCDTVKHSIVVRNTDRGCIRAGLWRDAQEVADKCEGSGKEA